MEMRLHRVCGILLTAVTVVTFTYGVSGLLKKLTNGSETYTTYCALILFSLMIFALRGNLDALAGRRLPCGVATTGAAAALVEVVADGKADGNADGGSAD